MNKIVTVIKPFTMQQNVFVYEGSNMLKVTVAEMDNLSDTILNLSKEYDANDIEIVGAKKFTTGIKDKLTEEELTKYNENKLNIKLTSN